MPQRLHGDENQVKEMLVTANHGAAIAVAMAGRANRSARGFGGGIYPITPQSECIEVLCAQEIERSHLVHVESEHSAMGVCIGFSSAGARSFTATSSNGLVYMAENAVAASYSRLPIVMMVVNRTIGPPWNIWADHGDSLMLRDAGWIQFYCEDNQEVADTLLLAFRLAEDHRVLLPVMVCQDAFVLSHTVMKIEMPEQEEVDSFLPGLDLPHRISDRPRTVGGLDGPHETEVHRKQHAEAIARALAIYPEIQDEMARVFGRRPADPVEPYRMDDAEIAIVSMGTTAATVRHAVDDARSRGVRAGALRIRMFRPLPESDIRSQLSRCERVAVLDRDISLGFGGVLWGELRALAAPGAIVQGYMLGLGGGDIRPEAITGVMEDLLTRVESGAPEIVEVG